MTREFFEILRRRSTNVSVKERFTIVRIAIEDDSRLDSIGGTFLCCEITHGALTHASTHSSPSSILIRQIKRLRTATNEEEENIATAFHVLRVESERKGRLSHS